MRHLFNEKSHFFVENPWEIKNDERNKENQVIFQKWSKSQGDSSLERSIFERSKIIKKKEKSRSNWNQMKIRKSTKYTRALRLFHDQKIKIKNTYNHKINERTHSSRILSKTQEQWVCLSNWSQKKKEMNQMHKINEIL